MYMKEVTILSSSHQQTGEVENGDAARREALLGRLSSIILDLETAIQNIHDAKKQISILHGTISSLKQVMKGV